MFSTFHNRKGFTLIELMIVVVIIGILAALAIPRFMTATTRSKQSEAKQLLKQVYTMQHAYRQGSNPPTYGDNGVTIAPGGGSFTNIGVEVMTNNLYTYALVAGAATFTCTATANLDDDAAVDTWTINETGILTCTINDAIL
jgi:prepilin-type N-terminal cleavage/methylation domain-containing protein